MAAVVEVPSFAERIRRSVQRAVVEGGLTGESDLRRIPYVGKWLAPRLSQAIAGTSARGSLRELYVYLSAPLPAGGVAREVAEVVAGRVGELCQNERNNLCVPSRRSRRRRAGLYSVRDTNKGCALAVPLSLLEVLQHNPASLGPAVPHGPRVAQGLQAAAARVVTRATTLVAAGGGAKHSAAAQCTCLAQDACAAQAELCTWQEAGEEAPGVLPQCIPRVATRGFEGVLPFGDQEERMAEVPPGLHLRGAYGPEAHGGRWRRPGALPRVTARIQELAWRTA